MGKVSKRLLLGILGAATSFGMIVGGKAIVDSVDNRATEVAAAETTGDKYVKITQADELEDDAEYLLVYEKSKYAFDGNSSNITGNGNYFSYTLNSDGSIAVSQDTKAGYFNLVESTTSGKYLLRAANGKYVYNTKSSNGISSGTESSANQYLLGVTFDSSGNCRITYSSTTLQFFNQKNNEIFKFYSSTQQPISLYKYEAGITADPESVVITLNGDDAGTNLTIFDGDELTLGAMVLPEGADQSVSWSIDSENVLFEDGYLIAENKTNEDIVVTVVAASTVDPSIKDEIQITVKPKIMTGIEVVQMPTKTEYTIGSEFDPSGIAIQAVYKDGAKPTDVTDQIEYSYGTFTEPGEVEVIATLKGTEFTAPIKVNVVERAVTEIVISGQKTSFNVEDSFTLGDGADIIASWNDGEIEEVATDNADLSFELVNSESAEIGSGTPLDSSYKVTLADNGKYVLVSYKGIAACYQISVKEPFLVTNGQFVKVSSADELAVGDRIVIAYKNNMMANYESGEYIASYAFEHGDNFTLEPSDLENIGVIELGKPLASSSDDSSFSFKQISGDAEQYLYCNGEKKISSTSDISGLGSKAYWQITKDNDCFAVTSKITGNYNLQYNDNSPRFTCYKGTMKNVDIFKFVTYTEEATNGWASEMMGSGICDTGVADSETWSLLELYYDDLSVGAQQLLQSYEADVSESASVLAQALYRYDYILDIYGTDRFNDYIRRGGTPSGAYGINPNGNDNLWAIVGLSLSAVISSAALLILRQKKRA